MCDEYSKLIWLKYKKNLHVRNEDLSLDVHVAWPDAALCCIFDHVWWSNWLRSKGSIMLHWAIKGFRSSLLCNRYSDHATISYIKICTPSCVKSSLSLSLFCLLSFYYLVQRTNGSAEAVKEASCKVFALTHGACPSGSECQVFEDGNNAEYTACQ